jgi:hypothetical protein
MRWGVFNVVVVEVQWGKKKKKKKNNKLIFSSGLWQVAVEADNSAGAQRSAAGDSVRLDRTESIASRQAVLVYVAHGVDVLCDISRHYDVELLKVERDAVTSVDVHVLSAIGFVKCVTLGDVSARHASRHRQTAGQALRHRSHSRHVALARNIRQRDDRHYYYYYFPFVLLQCNYVKKKKPS